MGKMLFSNLSAMLVLLLTTQGCAMGARKPDAMALSGVVRVVGNAPFTRLVLTTTDQHGKVRDYLLVGPLENELRKRYQGNRVTLEGTACESPTPVFTDCLKPVRIISGG